MGSQANRGGFAGNYTPLRKPATTTSSVFAPAVIPPATLERLPSTYGTPIFAPIKPSVTVDPVTGNRTIVDDVPNRAIAYVDPPKPTSSENNSLLQAFAPMGGGSTASVAPASLSSPNAQTGSVNAVSGKPTNWLLIGGVAVGALILGFIVVKVVRK